MYLSETAKLQIKQILMLWDELGHIPSFSEFDADERTPKANSLAYNFGSYSEAAKVAKSFYDPSRRKELDPPPPKPPRPPEEAQPKVRRLKKGTHKLAPQPEIIIWTRRPPIEPQSHSEAPEAAPTATDVSLCPPASNQPAGTPESPQPSNVASPYSPHDS